MIMHAFAFTLFYCIENEHSEAEKKNKQKYRTKLSKAFWRSDSLCVKKALAVCVLFFVVWCFFGFTIMWHVQVYDNKKQIFQANA